MNNKVSFLFGAGADSLYGICTGNTFASSLIKNAYLNERKQLLGDDIANCSLIHKQSRKIYLQTIESNKELACTVFDEAQVEKYIKYYNSDNHTEKEKKEIDDKCRKWYSHLTEADESDEIANFFLKYAVLFDVIDEKFNALRKLPLNTKAKKVINTYTSIFILMLKSLYEIPENFVWNYENIIDLLDKPYNKIDLNMRSYYKVLKNSGLKCNIITTNYTDICKKVLGKNVCYLHGNLKWFEDYKKLTIYDCSVKSEREKIAKGKHIFPFLLIPSGVKPLVCKKELSMFFEFSNILEKTEILCVLGYCFNSEDNHINSFVADWLRNPQHTMFYFNYKKSCDFSKFEWLDDNLIDRITVIDINDDNSIDEFENFLRMQQRS